MGELWKMIQLTRYEVVSEPSVSADQIARSFKLSISSLSLTLFKMIQLIRYGTMSEPNIGADQIA